MKLKPNIVTDIDIRDGSGSLGSLNTSLSFCRGWRVEGSMSRARVPCRGSRVTFFFQFFLEKVIIDAITVIKTNKKN